MTAPAVQNDEMSVLLDPPDRVKLKSGQVILLNRLKTRELLKLLRVITHGAGDRLLEELGGLNPNDDQNVFAAKMMLTLLMAIPDAESETVEFIFSLAKPVGLIDRPNLSKQDKERNLALWENLVNELENPELDDLITILESVIVREAADLASLGKRVSSAWATVQRVGKGKVANPPDPTSLSSLATSISDRSSSSATSSPLSTEAGEVESTTTSSVPTPSVSFAKPPQLFLDDVS